MNSIWTTIFLLFFFSIPALAQEAEDSTAVFIGTDSNLLTDPQNVERIVYDTLEDRPNTAAFYSMALPGLGQAYNKSYWKIPLIYSGAVVIGYYINYNHQLFLQYRDGLYAIRDRDDRTQPFNPNLSETTYERATSYWRRNRDLLMIAGLVLYLANIVDAHVDAHLALFNVDEDISMRFEPYFDQTAMLTNVYGISLKIRLN